VRALSSPALLTRSRPGYQLPADRREGALKVCPPKVPQKKLKRRSSLSAGSLFSAIFGSRSDLSSSVSRPFPN